MAAKSEAPRDPVRRWTLIILAAIVALYLYSIIADRMTPYTSQAIAINKPTQRIPSHRWRVSTGATKYSTPPGSYKAFRMERMHYSREWDNAGMPHSIFFSSRGHAIHGSNHPGLGTPASHGCVRLSLGNAATLFALVSARGVSNTKIVVRGPDPPGYHAATQIPQRRQPARPVGLFGGYFR